MIGRNFLVLLLLFISVDLLAQSPVQGDDLVIALGQRSSTTLVSKLKNYINDDYTKKGAQIIISNSKLTRVDLYNDKNVLMPDMSAFNGKLPKGLTFTSTIFEAKKALGEGYEESGDKGSSYTLTKEFPLNDLDSWQMNIMYNRGRINIVSLIYVEKGRAGAEDAETLAKTGIAGEDYFLMIRKNMYNFQVKTLLGLVGNADYEASQQRVFLDSGLLIELSKKKTIDKLVMNKAGIKDSYTGKTYKQFPYALPFGIKFSDDKNLVIQKCGPPQQQNGESMVYFEQNTEMQLFFAGNTLQRVEIYKPEEKK